MLFNILNVSRSEYWRSSGSIVSLISLHPSLMVPLVVFLSAAVHTGPPNPATALIPWYLNLARELYLTQVTLGYYIDALGGSHMS